MIDSQSLAREGMRHALLLGIGLGTPGGDVVHARSLPDGWYATINHEPASPCGHMHADGAAREGVAIYVTLLGDEAQTGRYWPTEAGMRAAQA